MADIEYFHQVINKDGKDVMERTILVRDRRGWPIRKVVRTEGEKVALVEEYHPCSGVLKTIHHSVGGCKEGFLYEFDEKENLIKIAKYKADRLVDLMLDFHHSRNDAIIEDDALVKKEVLFDNGSKQGLQFEHLREGIFTLSTYNGGKKNGPKVSNDFFSWEKSNKPFTTTYYISNKEVSEDEFVVILNQKKKELLKTETKEFRQKKALHLKQLRDSFKKDSIKNFLGDQFFKIRSQSALAIRVMNEKAYRSR